MTVRDRLYAAGVFGALLTVIALAVVVLKFGQHHPSPPSLTKEPIPAIPGVIAYLDDDGCVVTVRASGSDRTELTCTAPIGFGALSWLDANRLAYVGLDSPSPKWSIVDVTTHSVTPTTVAADQSKTMMRPDLAAISVTGDSATVNNETGELIVVANGVRTEIADFDTQDYHAPRVLTWSPDGQWLLLQYFVPRGRGTELWIVSRDGTVRGTLATEVSQGSGIHVSWFIDGAGASPKVDVTGLR